MADPESVLDFPDTVCRLVLLGKTGNGKSSTGNTLVGHPRFEVGRSFKSTTTKCQWFDANRCGINLEIVDTPGIFDTDLDDAVVTKEISRCVGIVSPGPHALLIVLRPDVKFTKEEAKSLEYIRVLFGQDIMRHVIVVFTHGDTLDESGTHIDEVLRDCPPALSQLLQETDGRYVIFNNKVKTNTHESRQQVRDLLLAVRGLLTMTDNRHFANPFLLRCEQTVMTNAEQLANLLEGIPVSGTVRQLIRAGLETKDRTEEMLHEILDSQQSQTKEQESKIRALEETLQQTNKLNDELVEQLEKEKKKWKCIIL